MQRDQPAGFALIGGTLAGALTMANHPMGHALLENFEGVALINRAVHSLAIAGTMATVYGLLRLCRAFGDRRALADAALVSYGFGAIAVMFAAIASGFVGTDMTGKLLQAGDAGRTIYDPVLEYNWAFNQACTRVFVVSGSVGIGLWSVAMFREPAFGRALGTTGILIAVAAIAGTIAGMPMNVHGFGAIVLAHGIWLIWTGTKLISRR
jgi:hypothetical protein